MKKILILLMLLVTMTAQAEIEKPNILLILLDDQRMDQFNEVDTPNIYRFFEENGTIPRRSVVVCPLCCPSRSSILTGLYPSVHGVTNNDLLLEYKKFITVPRFLKKKGYFTAHFGKYLNMHDGSPLPYMYNYTLSFDHDNLFEYINPIGNLNGVITQFVGHQTDILAEHLITMLDEKRDKPFFIYYAPSAPHQPKHAMEIEPYASMTMRSPNFNTDRYNKPDGYFATKPLGKTKLDHSIYAYQRQLRSLKHFDDSFSKIIEHVDLKTTAVIFYSDNGISWGENAITHRKANAFKEAVVVPFAWYWPEKDRTAGNCVFSNIDIPATIFEELGGLPEDYEFADKVVGQNIFACTKTRTRIESSNGSRGTGKNSWRSVYGLESYVIKTPIYRRRYRY